MSTVLFFLLLFSAPLLRLYLIWYTKLLSPTTIRNDSFLISHSLIDAVQIVTNFATKLHLLFEDHSNLQILFTYEIYMTILFFVVHVVIVHYTNITSQS